MHHFQVIKQKHYLLPENLDQLSNLDIGFAPVLLYSMHLDFNCCSSFGLSSVDKVTNGKYIFASAIANVVT